MKADRVLLIGNSHLAAPRNALRDWPERWPGFAPHFFGLPGTSLGRLQMAGGVLGSDDPEIRRQINFYNGTPNLSVTDYQVFVVVGGINLAQICRLQSLHRTMSFPSVQARAEVADWATIGGEIGAEPEISLISDGFMQAMIARRIRNSAAVQLIYRLAGLGQAPILFLPGPYPSIEALSQKRGEMAAMALRGDAGAFLAHFREALAEITSDVAVLIEQPSDTIAKQSFTAARWMRGSLRLNNLRDIRHGQDEVEHANTDFGGRQIDQIIAALAAL